jgi:hypothetical protein
MDKVRKPTNPECSTPLSESLRMCGKDLDSFKECLAVDILLIEGKKLQSPFCRNTLLMDHHVD